MLEKVVQAQLVKLYVSVRGKVYVLGTRRAKPPKGVVLTTPEQKRQWYSTRQTPGIADLFIVLPPPPGGTRKLALWHEAKTKDGRLSDDQKEFRDLVVGADLAHVAGGYDDAIRFLVGRGYLDQKNVPHYRLPAEAPL